MKDEEMQLIQSLETVNKVFFKVAVKELENQRWKVKFCHELKTSWERDYEELE